MHKEALIQKLKALIDGTDSIGEKELAERQLQQLVDKYNIDIDSLDDNKLSMFEVHVKGNYEETLLVQIVYKVTNKRGCVYTVYNNHSRRRLKSKMKFQSTLAQSIEVKILFDFYKSLYKKDLELFQIAFIQKHELFGNLPIENDDNNGDDYTREERLRMQMMSEGMSSETPLKQLQAAND